jgi:hypothetical protein
MPDIKQLISLQFDSTGCTSNFVYNLGDVNFDSNSPLENQTLRCAYFPLYNNSGLYFNSQEVSDRIAKAKPFAIYFKYRINKNNLTELAPIISYSTGDINTHLFLAIENHKYFIIHSSSPLKYMTTDISYTFDDEWHTFYFCFTEERNFYFMIDGRVNAALPYIIQLDFSEKIYIGYHYNNDKSYSFGGYIDDFNIFDQPIYRNNFLPPTNYIGNKDVISNYFESKAVSVYDKEIADTVEQARMHTVDKLNNKQLGWLPRKTNMTWSVEEDGYFRNGEYEPLERTRTYTAVNIMEINQPFASSSTQFMEGNLLTLIEAKKIYPMMIFINRYLVKLSEVYFIKSHDKYTLKFLKRHPLHSEEIKTLDIVILPFAIVYEEDYGERADMSPLYSFSSDGRFTTDDVNVYYYIDDKREPYVKQIGVRQHMVTSKQFDYNKIPDYPDVVENRFLRYIYKYGTLELVRFAEDGLGAFIKFDSTNEHDLDEVRYVDPDDNLFHYRHNGTTYKKGDIAYSHAHENKIPSYIRLRAVQGGTTLSSDTFDKFTKAKNEDLEFIEPGDTVTIFNGAALLNPKFYEIVGHNLIYVYNVYEAGIKFGRNITIQKLANPKLDHQGYMTSEAITIKTVEVQAVYKNQAVFNIPQIVDEDGYEYHKFLLFKGHVLMEDNERYVVDRISNTIRFIHSDDFLPKGRNIIFSFIKYNKSAALGEYYTDPVFVYANPDNNGIVEFDSPDGLYATKNNCMVFVNDTFVSPYRIRFLDGNRFQLLEDGDFTFTPSSNVVIVFIAVLNTLENPINERDTAIALQIKRGDRFILYDLGIPKKYKITLDNLLCFDEEGKYIPDLIGQIYNYNVIKRLKTSTPLQTQVRYMTCLYRTDSLENYANSLYYRNNPFIKEYIKGRQEYYEMDLQFDNFISDFNFTHSYDLTYGENLANSLDYIMNYDKNRMDSIYEKRAKITRKEYSPSGVNKNLTLNSNNEYEILIPRDEYYNNISRTYPIFFNNGKLSSDWHVKATEDMNYVKITLPSKISADNHYESIDFHGMNNYLIPLNAMAKIDKNINSDIFTRLITGEEFQKYFYARIKVKDFYNIFFPATVNVKMQEEYVPLVTYIGEDLFTCTIIPSPPYEINFYTKLEVEDMPKGTVVNLDDYIRAFDFPVTIDVPDSGEVTIKN